MANPRIILLFLVLATAIAQNLRIDTPSDIFQAISQFSSSLGLNYASVQNLLPTAAVSVPVSQPIRTQEVFDDVVFFHHIPSTFLFGEIFSFSGQVNSTKLSSYLRSQPAGKKTYPLSFVLIEENTGNQYAFTKQMLVNNRKFSHQCLFNKPGSFYFGVFLGEQARITPKIYKVIDPNEIPERPISNTVVPPKPQNLTLYVNENDLYISWRNQTPLTRVIISQTSPSVNRKEFIVSNDEGYLKVPYAQFANFTKSQTRIQISHATSSDICASERTSRFSDPLTTEVNVTEHLFQEIRYDEVDLDTQIKSMVKVNSELQIGGTSAESIDQTAVIVEPNNKIFQTSLQMNNSNKFMLKQKFKEEGAYIIEINHKNGYALVNTPVYAGNSYPFLPDYSDLHPLKEQNLSSNMSLTQMRNLMLDLINKRRKEFGVPSVTLDLELNDLAQKHSNDMGLRNYVGHQNMQGQNSGDRAQKMGIYSPVGENIALNEDIEYAQYRLDRSPIHLKNTINSLWTKVGIGIYKKYNGMYYITQEFSTQDLSKVPLTNSKLAEIKSQIMERLQANSPAKMTLNLSFSQQLQDWNNLNEYSAAKVNDIKAMLTANKVGKAKIMTFSAPYIVGYRDLVEQQGYFNYLGFNSVAISVKVKQGTLQALMIFY